MCGICGQFNYDNNEPVNKERIKKMTESISHRGPDDKGYYFTDSLGLGFRRLSIIDLQGGHQPMSSIDNQIWIAFNGEIYNFPDIKNELESKGYQFQTQSDTEVIIYGYKHWGLDVFNHLNGMFAIAIWDNVKKRLVLSRDRMGIKLIYYNIESGKITFGSEIRTITSNSKYKFDINTESLNLFLRYRYTPSPLTIYNDIFKLAPGTCLVAENGSYNIYRWWKYKPKMFNPKPKIKDAKEELLCLYKNAIKRHLISDVPVGLLLSGGIDSAMLLALMNEYGKSWQTFTVGYGEDYSDDELVDAARTAHVLNCSNSEIRINKRIFEESFSKVINCLEEPIATASIIPMYHLCKHVSENFKTALMGQGPDELFGGYKRHLGVKYGRYWRAIPEWMRRFIKSSLYKLPRSETIKRGMYSLDINDRMKRYQQVFSINPGDVIDGLFKENLIHSNTGDKILTCWEELVDLMENTDELGGLQFIEIRSSLPDELLMYADKLSMAHGLELRVPYLDTEIVEFVEKLQSSFKIKYGKRKWLHREICKHYLPPEIINRKKRAFAINVVDDWFRNSVDGKVNEHLADPESLIYHYLKFESVQKLSNEHRSGRHDNYKLLFSLVVFEEWLRNNH